MKTKMFWRTTLTAAFSFLLLSCATTVGSVNDSSNVVVSISPSLPNSSSAVDKEISSDLPEAESEESPTIDNEATTFAKNYWAKAYKKCGDNHNLVTQVYRRTQIILYEIKYQPEITAEGNYIPPRPLSEAERLNGVDPQPIEWQGQMSFAFTTYRIKWGQVNPDKKLVFSNTWDLWKDGYTFQRNLKKIKGEWNVTATDENPIKFDCSELSATNPSQEKKSSTVLDSNDLSDIYGIINGTIFNKKTSVVFAKPREFFTDSGKSSFMNLKFDKVSSLTPNAHFVDGKKLSQKQIEEIENH